MYEKRRRTEGRTGDIIPRCRSYINFILGSSLLGELCGLSVHTLVFVTGPVRAQR